MKKILLVLTWLMATMLHAQTINQTYRFDVRSDKYDLMTNHLSMGTPTAKDGSVFGYTNKYLTRNGKPWFALMGEIHYSRIPHEKWEEAILKMKSNGIDIIATYVFWNHHEELEGQWDWSGDRDLRSFVALCAKHHMYVWMRIGPWCHGEARNGGFPDWLLRKTTVRKDNPLFMAYTDTLYRQIAKQIEPYYAKNGGSIIGTQIENEYNCKSKAGMAYMLKLKDLARAAGIDLPYYSITSWPGTDAKQRDFLLMYGGYPDAPWSKGSKKLTPRPEYMFRKLANDASIGADITGTSKIEAYDFCPYLSAELGGGNQVTYHRRPFIDSLDCISLTYTMLGSGANGLGYYMFSGGVNPEGKRTTLEENKATAYPNDYSVMDYDFQSPMGQALQLRPSYHQMKLLHYMVNDFGESLITTLPFFSDVKPVKNTDNDTVRCAVRASGGAGFIFFNNYQRYVRMKDLAGVQLKIQTTGKELTIPEKPFTLQKDVMAVWPFNLKMGSVTLTYATAQPFCILNNGADVAYVFFTTNGVTPEFVFEPQSVKKIQINGKSVKSPIRNLQPGMDCMMQVTGADGKKFSILVLTREQALQCWRGEAWGKQRLVWSNGEVLFDGGGIRLLGKGLSTISAAVYPKVNKALSAEGNATVTPYRMGVFEGSTFSYTPITTGVKISEEASPAPLTDSPEFIELVKQIPQPMAKAVSVWNASEADTCYFRKTFTCTPGTNSRVYLALVADDRANVTVNGSQVWYGGRNNTVTAVDLTSYVVDGENSLSFRLENSHNKGSLTAVLFMLKGNEIQQIASDTTWMSATTAGNAAVWQPSVKVTSPKGCESFPWIASQPGARYETVYKPMPGCKSWSVGLSAPVLSSVNGLFAEVDYKADAIAIYQGNRLVNDEFYYGRRFVFNVDRMLKNGSAWLTFQLMPLTPQTDAFFEDNIRKKLNFNNQAQIENIRLVPEYVFNVR
jgi:hypothetical protein